MTVINHRQPHVFKSLQEKSRTKSIAHDFYAHRYRISDEPDKSTKAKIAVGSVVGTILPMLYFAKKQHIDYTNIKKLFKMKYGLKEMIGVSVGSIAGGVATGIMFDKKNTTKEKTDEGVFQFLNASIPPLIAVGLFKLADKYKKLNNLPYKIGSTIVGLGAGMVIAAKAANLINDPHDKVPDRKLTIKDSVANIDDALGTLVLAKFPLIEKLHADRVLPAIYAWCGYRAGEAN